MIFHVFERETGEAVWELDGEAIEYLMDGLITLRDSEPGTELSTPIVTNDADGLPATMSDQILLRAEDED